MLEATLAAMEKLGATRGRIAAAIGPCISQANYEVGDDFRARFGADDARAFSCRRTGRAISASTCRAMSRHGWRRRAWARSQDLALCTYPPENGFFSFRRTTHRGEPDYGREISAIVLTQ